MQQLAFSQGSGHRKKHLPRFFLASSFASSAVWMSQNLGDSRGFGLEVHAVKQRSSRWSRLGNRILEVIRGRSFVILVYIGIVKTTSCYSSICCRIMMGLQKHSIIPLIHGMFFWNSLLSYFQFHNGEISKLFNLAWEIQVK